MYSTTVDIVPAVYQVDVFFDAIQNNWHYNYFDTFCPLFSSCVWKTLSSDHWFLPGCSEVFVWVCMQCSFPRHKYGSNPTYSPLCKIRVWQTAGAVSFCKQNFTIYSQSEIYIYLEIKRIWSIYFSVNPKIIWAWFWAIWAVLDS